MGPEQMLGPHSCSYHTEKLSGQAPQFGVLNRGGLETDLPSTCVTPMPIRSVARGFQYLKGVATEGHR